MSVAVKEQGSPRVRKPEPCSALPAMSHLYAPQELILTPNEVTTIDTRVLFQGISDDLQVRFYPVSGLELLSPKSLTEDQVLHVTVRNSTPDVLQLHSEDLLLHFWWSSALQ